MSDELSNRVSAAPQPVRLVCVGAGPGTAMLLERIVANRGDLAPEVPLEVHVVDPHPPGGGRIWRRDQSALLKLNSMLEDVAFFTDSSSVIEGSITAGPTLADWVKQVRRGAIPHPEWADDALRREITHIDDRDFPTRRLASAYLGWAYNETRRRAAASDHAAVSFEWHPEWAVRVVDAPGAAGAAHVVHLQSGATLAADVVVYGLGHNGTLPSDESTRLAEFAGRNGLDYVAPAFTADVDLSWVRAGDDVIVRGMGLAAVDLVVLLTEGRGGAFARDASGVLTYRPSGREPMLHLGSGRGVPYRSKITSRLVGEPVALEYLGRGFHESIRDRAEPLDFVRDVWPRVAAELITGYYRELFTGHPVRVQVPWADFAPRLRDALMVGLLGGVRAEEHSGGGRVEEHSGDALAELVREAVPLVQDRFDFDAFDRPLRGEGEFGLGSPGASENLGDRVGTPVTSVHSRVRAHIAEDLRQRTSQHHSAVQGLFMSALHTYLSLAEVPPERWSARSRTHDLPRMWHRLFSYVASGPPGHRLEELRALADAGVVQFLGGDLELRTNEPAEGSAAEFEVVGRAGVAGDEARSQVAARVLIDAWLPEARAAQSDNVLLRRLVADGRVRELAVNDASSTGQVEVETDGSLPGHPRQFGLGAYTSGPVAGAFTRPGLNSLPFRIHDRTARAILRAVAEVSAERGSAGLLPLLARR